MTPPTPRSTLFPYTTLFRSLMLAEDRVVSGVRSQIRQLQVLAQNYKIQKQQVELAYYLRDSSREALLQRSEEHTSELQSLRHLVCRLLLEKKKKKRSKHTIS